MTVDMSTLTAEKSIEEIRQMIRDAGADYHVAETKDDLIKRLAMIDANKLQQGDGGKASDVKPIYAPTGMLSKEQVLEAVRMYTDRGLEVKFENNDSVWHFVFNTKKFSKVGQDNYVPIIREDSGSMTMPLKIVKRAAEMVVKPTADKKSAISADQASAA